MNTDGTDIIALVKEIRDSKYYIPELSFVEQILKIIYNKVRVI